MRRKEKKMRKGESKIAIEVHTYTQAYYLKKKRMNVETSAH